MYHNTSHPHTTSPGSYLSILLQNPMSSRPEMPKEIYLALRKKKKGNKKAYLFSIPIRRSHESSAWNLTGIEVTLDAVARHACLPSCHKSAFCLQSGIDPYHQSNCFDCVWHKDVRHSRDSRPATLCTYTRKRCFFINIDIILQSTHDVHLFS